MLSTRGKSTTTKPITIKGTPERLSAFKRPSSMSISASKRMKTSTMVKEEEGPKTALIFPYQQLILKHQMVKVEAIHEGVLSVITASPVETFMTKRQSTLLKVDWQGPYPMWKDTKEIQLALDDSAGTELVMVMPGEDESHRRFARKLVHAPNLRACAIVDHYRGAFFLGPHVENAICGTVYIIERAYDPEIDYDAIEDGKTELPIVDISDDNLAMVSGVWADDDTDDDDEE
jgi:hypothetical protein